MTTFGLAAGPMSTGPPATPTGTMRATGQGKRREAGTVFVRTKPKLAAYTHLVFLGNDRISPATLDDLIAETRHTYGGPLEVGEDLMSFEIGETVHVHRYDHRARALVLAAAQRQGRAQAWHSGRCAAELYSRKRIYCFLSVYAVEVAFGYPRLRSCRPKRQSRLLNGASASWRACG